MFCLVSFFLQRECKWGRWAVRERESAWNGETGRGNERENHMQAPCSSRSWTQGLIHPLWDHDLSRNQQWEAQPTEPPRSPCGFFFFFKEFYTCFLICSSFSPLALCGGQQWFILQGLQVSLIKSMQICLRSCDWLEAELDTEPRISG